MHRFFVEPGQIGPEMIRIAGGDVNHIRNVLRMKPGEEFHAVSEAEEKNYRCRIEEIEDDCVTARILWIEDTQAELPSRITLFQGIPKSDKMELIIQKAVELGAYEVVPVAMQRSIVRLTGGKAEAKVRRWNAISESAAKQAKRSYIPRIHEVASFRDAVKEASLLDMILLPYELAEDMDHTREILESIKPGWSIGIFIGPEGGFERDEVDCLRESGAKVITLGRRILRTETAGMALLSVLMMLLEGRTSDE